MSDRRLIVASLLVMACAVALPAQQDAAALAARRTLLKTRVDSLRAVVDAMEAASRDSVIGPEVRVGTLRVRTTALLHPAADEAVKQAVATARRVLGADADLLASRLQFTLREQRGSQRWSFFPTGATLGLRANDRITSVSLDAWLDGKAFPGFGISYPMDRAALSSDVLSVLERAAAAQLPAPIEPWLEGRMPLRPTTADFWPELYRSLATAGASSVRRCVAGERSLCRLALALDSLPGDRVAAWYSEADYPALARVSGDPTLRSRTFRSLSTDEQEDCTVRGQLDLCRRMLSQLPKESFFIPMPGVARASLARLALETGGLGAVERMRASDGASVGAQLSAAAGLPVDSLVGIWQQRVIAARPGSPLPNATFVLASMACIVVCGAWAARGQPWK